MKKIVDIAAEPSTDVLLQQRVKNQLKDQLGQRLVVALLTQTNLPLRQVAQHAGFANTSELARATKQFGDKSPNQLRQIADADAEQAACRKEQQAYVTVTLPIQGTYDHEWVFSYLLGRALQGVEEVNAHCYRRRVSAVEGQAYWVEVKRQGRQLIATLPLTCDPAAELLMRVQRLFDLGVDGDVIDRTLMATKSPAIAASVAQAPGLRVPGAWDGFETMVRAVLGQQVSVARGTELANRMIGAYGRGDFPQPAQLIQQEIAELGMPGNRGRAISTMADWVSTQSHPLQEGTASEQFISQLADIKGIGPWTQNYMRLRVAKDVDAFPHNDWVVLKQLQTTPAKALTQSEDWRPWRAYALMHIWRLAGLQRKARKN